ncbi:MAG: LptF/LptG family permease [Candidatus Hydrogenedentota bacterium]
MKIIEVYILKDFTKKLIISLLLFTALFVTPRLFEILYLGYTRSLPVELILRLTILSLPQVLTYSIPVSGIIAIFTSLGIMSFKKEIIAIQSCGISPLRVTGVLIIFSLLIVTIMLYLQLELFPRSYTRFKDIILIIRSTDSLPDFTSKSLITFENVTLYFSKLDMENKRGEDVFVSIKENKVTKIINAKNAEFNFTTEILNLKLFSGTIERKLQDKTTTLDLVPFNFFELNIPAKFQRQVYRTKTLEEMTLAELLSSLKNKANPQHPLKIELFKKIMFSISFFPLSLLSISLSIKKNDRRSSVSAGYGIMICVVYYLLNITGFILAQQGMMDYISLGITTIVFTIFALYHWKTIL